MESVRQQLQSLSAGNNGTDITDCEYISHNGIDNHTPPPTPSHTHPSVHNHICVQDASHLKSSLHKSAHPHHSNHLSHHSTKCVSGAEQLKENGILHGRRSRHLSKSEEGDENAQCSKKMKRVGRPYQYNNVKTIICTSMYFKL